jgi:hypothetical protein
MPRLEPVNGDPLEPIDPCHAGQLVRLIGAQVRDVDEILDIGLVITLDSEEQAPGAQAGSESGR